MSNKRLLVVSNYVFDSTPDLFKLLTKIRDNFTARSILNETYSE